VCWTCGAAIWQRSAGSPQAQLCDSCQRRQPLVLALGVVLSRLLPATTSLVTLAAIGCAEPTVQPAPQPTTAAPVEVESSDRVTEPPQPQPSGSAMATPEPIDSATPEQRAGEPEDDTRGDVIAQCNALIEVINREQGPLKASTGSDTAALMKLGALLDGVSSKVAAVPLTDATLIGLRNDYAAMARELAVASRDTAAALQSNDAKLAAKAAKGMSSFGPREDAIVERLNGYCQKQSTQRAGSAW